MTVATDSASLYQTERAAFAARRYPAGFDGVDAGEVFGAFLAAAQCDNLIELTQTDRRRIFNLGYFTWVEQQGVALEDFERRRDQSFWDGIAAQVPVWDRLIEDFNAEAG
jgi:hypothetical protein